MRAGDYKSYESADEMMKEIIKEARAEFEEKGENKWQK